MKSFFKGNNKNQKGAAMLIVVFFFIFTSVITLFTVATPSIQEFRNVNNSIKSKQTYFSAESSLEDIIYRIRSGMNVDSNESLSQAGFSVNSQIIETANQKQIIASSNLGGIERTITATLATGHGASFNYGIQVGAGGLSMGNNSVVNGNVYSNGTITSAIITGTAISANRASSFADQSNGVGVTPSYDIRFADSATRPDFAQSFTLANSEIPSKFRLYIKKTGSPVSATVTIRGDSGGNPSTNVFATGTLNSALVKTNYDWVDVPLNSTSILPANTTLWAVVDMNSSSAVNYYEIGGSQSSYANGLAKVGTRGGVMYTSEPNIVSNSDAFFEIFIGGYKGRILNSQIGTGGNGDAWANEVSNTNATGNIFCKTGSSNNKVCDTTRENPIEIPLPVSNSEINSWKSIIQTNGISVSGNLTINNDQKTPRDMKVLGSVSVTSNATWTLQGNLWITGDISISNNAKIKLDPSYGSSSGMIIVDGRIIISNNGTVEGSGSQGSHIMLISNSTVSPQISLSSNVSSAILVAPTGRVAMSGNATAKSVIADSITINNNSSVNYETGLANTNFSLGPSGGWQLVNWTESQ